MKHRPFPEIVTGESDWEVFEENNQPRTDMTNKKMYVPLDDDCHKCGEQHGRVIRRHELAHVKWSPKSMGKLKKGVIEEAVHLLEEIRVNHLLTKFKIPMNAPHKCLDEVRAQTRLLVEKASVAELLKWCLAGAFFRDLGYYHFNGNAYRKAYREHAKNKLSYELEATLEAIEDFIDSNTLTNLRIKDLLFVVEQTKYFHNAIVTVSTKTNAYASKISFQKVKKYAEELSSILALYNERPEEDEVLLSKEQQSKLREVLEDDEDLSQEEAYSEAGLDEPMSIKQLHRRNKSDERKMSLRFQEKPDEPRWGKMEIYNPPCTVNLSNKLRQGYTNVPKDYGQTPNKLQRYCVDKKVFSRKQKIYGGTVLIDASGSMDFDGQDILDVMSEVPAVTIAMYNGHSSDGALRIIARNGRRVNDDYLYQHSGYGNVVDLPALEWLGRQEPKRIWVSDMQVVPVNGTSKEALRQCADAVKKYNIMRLADIKEVKQFAKQLNVLQ